MEALLEGIHDPLLRNLFRFLADDRLSARSETRTEEHSLRYTVLFQEYNDLLSAELEAFTKESSAAHGATEAELLEACREPQVARDPIASALLETFFASTDYRCFVQHCVDRAKTRAAEGKDSGARRRINADHK
ncbi:hypothetical protein M885DRAFT_566997 [Pelagophyceae sp. CCMP2097]|nr:hypothetical protein M885DRAFT_566997 [Pelagophyceae sp. CCMP2097]